MKKEALLLLMIILLATSVYAQEIKFIEPKAGILTPQDSSYMDYKNIKAHYITPQLQITDIDKYDFYDNGVYVNTFNGDDTKPTTAVITLPGTHNFTVIGYKNNQAAAQDTVKFNLLFSYFDLYDIQKESPPMYVDYTINQADVQRIKQDFEKAKLSSQIVDVKQSFIDIDVVDKLTGEAKKHTIVRVEYSLRQPVANLTLYEIIPKDVAKEVNEIIFNQNYDIVEADPIIMWKLKSPEKKGEVSFFASKQISPELKKEIKTIPIIEEEIKVSFLYYLLPIIIIPVVIFFFIYFRGVKKR